MIKVSAGSVSGEGLQTAAFLLCPHITFPRRMPRGRGGREEGGGGGGGRGGGGDRRDRGEEEEKERDFFFLQGHQSYQNRTHFNNLICP